MEVPSWPIQDNSESKALQEVLASGRWGRLGGKAVSAFELEYTKLTGAKHCLAVANGTSALLVALGVLGIGPGDEVIVPPYTFIATVNAVLRNHALPVFADVDPATLQMDPARVAEQITPNTRAIIMVHMAGGVGELDAMRTLAAKRGIPLIEDAAQAHLAQFQGRHVGTFGTLGCFSFQASKNLNSGEGGAVVTNDSKLAEAAFAFHNNSRGNTQPGTDFHYQSSGLNLRLTEFQGALLLAQMQRLESQAIRRSQNARLLDEALKGHAHTKPITVAKDCTRHAYHLYMARSTERDSLLKRLRNLGVPASGGYAHLPAEPFLENTFQSRGYQRVYGKNLFAKWRRRNECPINRLACEQTIWLTQNTLLAGAATISKITKTFQS
jgi:dTDP-4-amino-4,6-dideoxygalactose transaminase